MDWGQFLRLVWGATGFIAWVAVIAMYRYDRMRKRSQKSTQMLDGDAE